MHQSCYEWSRQIKSSHGVNLRRQRHPSRALEDSDIPTLPYLINKRDAEGEEVTMKLPTNEQLHEAVEKMLTDSEDPQFENNMDQVREILLHENQKEQKGLLTELEQKDNENMSEVTNIKLLTFS